MGKRKGGPRQLRYRRFATAAEAIRFAVEELPAVRALGAWMQVGQAVGARPVWLVAAIRGGKKLDDFLIDKSAGKRRKKRRSKR